VLAATSGQHEAMSDIQFGVNVHAVSSRRDFHQLVHRADELGYDVFAAPDHLGGLAPFAALTSAGMISERLRLRTYVLNAGFWNPARRPLGWCYSSARVPRTSMPLRLSSEMTAGRSWPGTSPNRSSMRRARYGIGYRTTVRRCRPYDVRCVNMSYADGRGTP